MKSHIQVPVSSKNKLVITCGSPERAEYFSKFLENPEAVSKNREYHSYYGTYKGQTILILSHGVGASGAAIAFSEIIQAGAEKIIRIGTAGGLYDSVEIGDIVVPTAAVREDGTSRLLLPIEYPAVADLELTLKLHQGILKQSSRVKSGVIVTSDLFYPGKMESTLSLHQKCGAIAVEMECSTLFTLGFVHNIKTAAIVVLDGNPLQHKEGVYDPSFDRLKKSLENSFFAALDAILP